MHDAILSYIDSNRERFLEELKDWLRIPSVSSSTKHKADVGKAADFLVEQLNSMDIDTVELWETEGFPVVFGHHVVDPSLPTVMIYGHYDVQPPDPLNLWDSPPFEPVIKDEKIYARGATDDKGQCFMHIKAIETLLNTGGLPCNVKFFIEGEEEVGSPNLAAVLRERKDDLQADVLLISDTSMIANDTPSIAVGLRGLSYLQVEVVGPNRDLHSGSYGGAVANPINVLCRMIASLQDEDKRITIPGFYDDVLELPQEQRDAMAKAPFDVEEYKAHLDIDAVEGEAGYSTRERCSIRPTLDVNGIWGGYMEEGAKTVLPSKANAKISMRLVPNQDDDKITELFTKHFEAIAPDSVKVKVEPHHGGQPFLTDIESDAYKAADAAMSATFDKQPIPMREGGSIPILADFKAILKMPIVLMGFGLDTDALHSPNEHYGLFNFYKGIETIALYHHKYKAQKS